MSLVTTFPSDRLNFYYCIMKNTIKYFGIFFMARGYSFCQSMVVTLQTLLLINGEVNLLQLQLILHSQVQ